MLSRMLSAALTTACCPTLSPQLGDSRWDDGGEEGKEAEERLAVTLEMMAFSTRGTTTTFHSRASHLEAQKPVHQGIARYRNMMPVSHTHICTYIHTLTTQAATLPEVQPLTVTPSSFGALITLVATATKKYFLGYFFLNSRPFSSLYKLIQM